MNNNNINRNFSGSDKDGSIPQYNLFQILLMYAWPIVWFMFLIYGIGPIFVKPDGTFPVWAENLIGLLGNGAELVAAIFILRKEGYRLKSKNLRDRINLKFPKKFWKWAACIGAFIIAFGGVLALLPLEAKLANLIPPPDWIPHHPLKYIGDISETPSGISLISKAISWVYQTVVVFLIGNILGEELYYRAALQPKMRGVFGKWNWVASGIGFGLKHLYFWWRIPYLIPVGCALGFIYGPLGSFPLALFFHWLGNVV